MSKRLDPATFARTDDAPEPVNLAADSTAPAPRLDGAGALVSRPPPEPPVLDAHGFDPADYRWIPMPRRRRNDGWTPITQRRFIETLADTGSVSRAAREVCMSLTSCYRLRRESRAAADPQIRGFADAWDAAIAEASGRLVDIAMDRAVNGVEDHVLDRNGRHVYTRYRYSDRLLTFLLRAHHPRYRYADAAAGGARAALDHDPAPALPVGEAIARLEPAEPADPREILPPGEYEAWIADGIANAAEDERIAPLVAARRAALAGRERRPPKRRGSRIPKHFGVPDDPADDLSDYVEGSVFAPFDQDEEAPSPSPRSRRRK